MNKYYTFFSTLFLLLSFSACQKNHLNSQIFEVKLTTHSPDGRTKMRWSPKGEKLFLNQVNSGLETKLNLGANNKPISLRLEQSRSQKYYDVLIIDMNRDGSFSDEEPITTAPNIVRGKIWSSFDTVLNIPVFDPYDNKKSTNSYPISFWYVENPNAENNKPILRYSRRGWMLGKTIIDSVEAFVLLTEMKMDGVFDTSDSWSMATNENIQDLYSSKFAHQVTEHAWLGEHAFHIKEIHESGRKVLIEKYDPGITRDEEERQKDFLAVDRNAPRSGSVVAFSHDFNSSEKQSRDSKKNLFIDFETTWCGPCKTMDKLVYTADEVVEASQNVISVKVDGDEHSDLVKRFKVEAYPTILLLSPEGKILKRAVGYQNVKLMSNFLRANKK